MGTIYPGYIITRLRGEAIGILVIAATLDLRSSPDLRKSSVAAITFLPNLGSRFHG